MSARIVQRFALQSAVLIVLVLLQGTNLHAQDLTQIKPNTNGWGGLVSSVTVHPRDPNIIFIGTGRGGLYKSTNGGQNWNYRESFPTQSIQVISFSPSNPDRLIATSLYDTKTSRSGGIWLSTDQGDTWNLPPSSIPPITARCPERVSAGGISWVPKSGTVWVATDCGLMRSDDLGDHWTPPIIVDPATLGAPGDPNDNRVRPDRMFTVLAIDPDHVIAGGEGGHYYMHDGRSWHQSIGARPSFYCPRGLAAAPRNPRLLFRADYGSEYLQYSADQGITWQNFPSPDLVASNAGPFVRATGSPLGPNYFEVYFGTGYDLKRTTLQYDVSTWSSATWQTTVLDHHPDPQDIGFHPRTGRPLLLVGDFGVMKSADDGATWFCVGADRAGLNALEIRSVGVQDFPTLSSRPDLTFVTWHNNAWNSTDRGVTWIDRGIGASGIGEGFGIHTSGPALNDPNDAFVSLRPLGESADLYGRGITALPAPFAPPRNCHKDIIFYNNPLNGRPYILNASYGRNDPHGCEGVTVIYDQRDVRGTTQWQEVARGNSGEAGEYLHVANVYGSPQIAVKGARASLYQCYVKAGSGVLLLSKVSNINRAGGASPSMPAMEDFGSISVMTNNNKAPVFAVKPDDDQVLIAPDRTYSLMKMSTDGGEHWTPMDLLTRLVTDDDRLRFETIAVGGNSQATVIAFDPYNTNRVLVGTMESGLLLSMDGGNSWERLPDSESIPSILDIAFARNGTVYIASAGRGLWKWEQRSVFNRPDLLYAWLCLGDCTGKLMHDPARNAEVPIKEIGPASRHIIARKGYITNFFFDERAQQLTLLATNPDSIITYKGKGDNLPLQVLASEKSDKHQNCPACNQDAEKGLGVKVLVIEGSKVVGYMAAGKDKREIPDKIMFGNEMLPDYKPSLLLDGVSRAPGYGSALQGSMVTVKGSGFAPTFSDKETPQYVTVYLNGQPMREHLETDGKGTFELSIELKTVPGDGIIYCVQQTGSGRITAKQIIMILNHDGKKR